MPRLTIAKRIAVLTVAALASGCVVRSGLAKRWYAPLGESGPETAYSPVLSVETEVEVGESMVSITKSVACAAIVLSEPVNHAGENLGHQILLRIPQGTLTLMGSDGAGMFFEAPERLVFQSGTSELRVRGGVYVPRDSPAATEVFWLATNDERIPLNADHPGIQFTPTQVRRPGANSFKRELVYGGVSQNTITVLYREFLNDMARPAFSQELRYDLSQSDVIGYRGARLQIIRAANTAIKFKTLKHLE